MNIALRNTIVASLVVLLMLPVILRFSAPVGASDLHAAYKKIYCSVCGKRISGRYIYSNGKYYCSKRCLEHDMPKCCICGRPATIKRADGKFFCKNCYNKSLPVCANCGRHVSGGVQRGYKKVFLCKSCAALPKCFACGMPATRKFSDGRFICKKCAKTAVLKQAEAISLSNEVRRVMKEKLGLFTNHNVSYQIVDSKGLHSKMQRDDDGMELGLFRFEQTVETTTTDVIVAGVKTTKRESKVKDTKYLIYYLYGIPKDKFIEVAAHELAHDWMQGHYPHIESLKLKEGWSEFVASLVNKVYGHGDMNRRMELNKSKIYGDGYRFVKNYVAAHGIEGLFDLFEKENRADAPIVPAKKN